jgi:hypothetical protein
MRHRRPVGIVLLALLVLFVQWRAAVHEISHLSEPPEAAWHPDKQHPHSHVCQQCAAFAPFGGVLPSLPISIEPQEATAPPAIPAPARPFISRVCCPYSSRAPPPLA